MIFLDFSGSDMQIEGEQNMVSTTSCESLPCNELYSCKVFQEFIVGIDLFCNTTSDYEFSDLRLLS